MKNEPTNDTHPRLKKKPWPWSLNKVNRYGRYKRRGQLIDRVSIDERPFIVDQRQGIGDWELDTLIAKGYRQAIVSLTERESPYTLMRKVKRKTADSLSNAIIQLLTPLVHYVKTLTSGNAKGLADHNIIAQTRTADVYFAYPYASKVNNRPRKYLGIKTPNQVFLGITPALAFVS